MPVWPRSVRRSHLGTDADRATFRTLHTAALASPALREGLTTTSAARSLRHLRALLGTPAAVLTRGTRMLAWDGLGEHHSDQTERLAVAAIEHGGTQVDSRDVRCADPGCDLALAVAAPLQVEDGIVGTLQVFAPYATAGLIRAVDEVAQWVSGQLDLAELDASRTRLIEAELRALRAQISPHFIYNSLGAIASFVRTDPDRARELLLEFADFTRYSFRRYGEFTTLEDELHAIERYLLLEQARFGDRLKVTLRVAPEVLPVTVPFLCLQPLVENACQHGLEGRPEGGRITILAQDRDHECVVSVEDDGAGADPEQVRRVLAGDDTGSGVALRNVDERLRLAYGDDYGLVIETAQGAGTRAIVRFPKYAPGLHT